jgi:hypothetical protein
MVFATKSVGSRTTSPFNGNNGLYKVGYVFSALTITGRDAPDKTGTAAQPILVRTLGISVNGYNATASSRFALYASNGTAGFFTGTVSLPNGGTSDASMVSSSITTTTTVNGTAIAGRPCFGGTSYLISFTKANGVTLMWDIDSALSGTVIKDLTNSGTTTNFNNDGTYTSGAGLVFNYGYDVLPLAPTISSVTASGDDITVTWTAPTNDGGTPVTGYRIQRSIDGGATWSTIVADSQTPATLTYTDFNQAFGNTYYYRVAAINQVALVAGSTYSGPYSSSTGVVLPALAGNATSSMTINLSAKDQVLTLFSNGGSGIPFDGVEISYGAEKLYTSVTATSLTSGPQQVDAISSQAVYGVRSLAIDGLLNKEARDVESVARNLLWQYYKPDLRIESISINLKVLSETYISTLLNLEIDDAMQVEFTPRGIGDPIVSVGRIIGIDHQIDKVNHVITIRMSNAENNILTLDSDRQGFLDTNPLG